MVAQVWTSGIKIDPFLGDKLSLRWKLFDGDWSPAQHVIEDDSDEYLDGVN